jgi:hypothetical protein
MAVGIDVPFGATRRRVSPQAPSRCRLLFCRKTPAPTTRGDTPASAAGCAMRVRKERSNDTYQPSHDAACGLVFSSLDHVWLLNALLIGRWPGRVPSCKCTGRKLISMPKKRRPVAKLPPYLKAILWPLRSEGPVIACEGKPVKPRLGRRGVRARDRARRDADVTLYPWRHALS